MFLIYQRESVLTLASHVGNHVKPLTAVSFAYRLASSFGAVGYVARVNPSISVPVERDNQLLIK